LVHPFAPRAPTVPSAAALKVDVLAAARPNPFTGSAWFCTRCSAVNVPMPPLSQKPPPLPFLMPALRGVGVASSELDRTSELPWPPQLQEHEMAGRAMMAGNPDLIAPLCCKMCATPAHPGRLAPVVNPFAPQPMARAAPQPTALAAADQPAVRAVEKRTTGLKEITGAPLDLIDASMPAVVSGRGSAELLETDTCAGAGNRATLAAAAGTAEEEPSSIKARSEACGDPSLDQGKEPANGRIRAYKAAMQMEPMAEWSRAPDMPFGPKDPDEVSKQGEEAKPRTMQLKVTWPNGMQEVLECKPDSKLEKLMLASCERRGVAMKDVRFLFDGDRIGVNDTPNKLGMEDGDSIDAFMRPLYGVNYEASNPNSWGMVTDPELFEAARDDLLEAALVAQMDVASSELEDSAEATRSRMASPTAELEDSAEAATRLATHEREQGIRRMHEGDYRAALDHFVTALKCFSKLQGRSRAAPDANTYSLAQAACVFYGVDVAQRLLPDVLCKKARVLCLLGAHEDALEATEDAAALHPRLLKPSCVAAIAYRGLHRQADAQRMLDKCERLWQEAMAVRSQAALLTAFQRYIARAHSDCVRVHL